MSFRGRYPSKFRRTGNFHGHERPVFSERGRPFKRRYNEESNSANFVRKQDFMPDRGRGRGRGVERDRDYYSNRGRGRPFKKYVSDRGMRPSRPRGRVFRGRQSHYRGGRGRKFESPGDFDNEEKFFERNRFSGDLPEENEYFEDDRHFDEREIPSDEWYEDEGDRYHDIEEGHVPFERRSPLTIHRRFDDEEFDRSPERSFGRSRSRSHSRSHLRRSTSLERRHFSDERQHSFERSPAGRLGSIERRDAVESRRRSMSLERKDSFTGHYRRSHSFDRREISDEHQRSVSPYEREIPTGYNRHSLERSLSPPRSYRSREGMFQSNEREGSIPGSSRRSLERQIAYEKERLQRILEQEKKIHEKRSESSIERFLDDCKRSFENNRKSHSVSRSNSFDGRDYRHRRNERYLERSVSPVDRSRTFKGLDSITVERGRSLERSNSPVRRSSNYSRTAEFSPERHRDFSKLHERNAGPSRRSRSPEYHNRRRSLSRNLSPEVSFNERLEYSKDSRSSVFRERSPFLEQRERPFLGEREDSVLERRERPFLEEQTRDFLEDRSLGYRGDNRHSAPYNTGRHFDRRSPSQTRSFKGRDHFLGVGDGPFPENRPIVKNKNDYHDKIPSNSPQISKGGSMDINERYREGIFTDVHESRRDKKEIYKPKRLEDRLSYHDDHENCQMDLSPISHAESLRRKEYSMDDKNRRELTTVSQTRNFEKERRPSSNDSMQKFLAELEEDDRSRTSNDGFQQHETQNISERYIKKESSYSFDEPEKLKQFGTKNVSSKISKEEEKCTPTQTSYYDFKFQSKLPEKLTRPLDENNQQEKLFNAYESSLMDQTSDAYNENLFQGRYEQSTKKWNKDNSSKVEKMIPPTQGTQIPSMHSDKISEVSNPLPQPISSRPSHYQHFNNSYREIPHNITSVFSGGNVRPDSAQFSQLPGPMQTFQQTPGGLPIVHPGPFQQNSLLPNQSQISQSSTYNENPMFSRRDNKFSNQHWENQSARYHNYPEQSMFTNNNQQNQSFPVQSFQSGNFQTNSTPSQIGNVPLNLNRDQSYSNTNPVHPGMLNRQKSQPSLSLDNQNIKTHPWLAGSESNQVSKNMAYGDNSKKKYPVQVQHNVKEVIVLSDDEGNVDENYDLVFMSDGIVMPTSKTLEKYKNCIPSFDVLGKILKGFVIYFGVNDNSELRKDPIEVLQESFTSSECFGRLDIEEKSEYKPPSKSKHICELRWQGLLLSRGEGDSQEESRYTAGIALINALAKTCFTIQTKYGYYNSGRFPKFMLKHPEKQGYYKIIKRDEIIKSVTETVKKLRAQGLARGVDATHVNAVISFMDEFFRDEKTHCELIFGPTAGMEYTLGELQTIAKHATSQGLQYRWFHGTKKVKVLGRFLGVSRYLSPQALMRYLVAEKGDTVRYRLFPPQGPKIDLLTCGNFYSPNMIKTILHMIGPDGNLMENYDHSKAQAQESSNTWDEPNQSNQDVGQSNVGIDQYGSGWPKRGATDIQSNQGNNPQPQQYQQNTNPRLQDHSSSYISKPPFHYTNPQSRGFDQSYQGSSQGITEPYAQGGYKRNVPFQGGSGKRGKWT